MKILIKRVQNARLLWNLDGALFEEGKIAKGLLVFLGIEQGDTVSLVGPMIEKVINCRIFENQEGKFHYSLKEKAYDCMCIPNFTLCALTEKGRRPSFENAMAPAEARDIFEAFIEKIKNKGIRCVSGKFGAEMYIENTEDGPVNLILNSRAF